MPLLHEVKLDGYRGGARINKGRLAILTRSGPTGRRSSGQSPTWRRAFVLRTPFSMARSRSCCRTSSAASARCNTRSAAAGTMRCAIGCAAYCTCHSLRQNLRHGHRSLLRCICRHRGRKVGQTFASDRAASAAPAPRLRFQSRRDEPAVMPPADGREPPDRRSGEYPLALQ